MATTLKDIARALNVSVATVSKALADSPEISGATKVRVLEKAQALGYYPNLVAKGLRFQRSRMVGVVVDSVANEFASKTLGGLQEELLRCGYQALVIGAGRSLDLERAAVTSFLERAVDGIVFADTRLHRTDELPSQVADGSVPTVFINRLVSVQDVHYVGPDDFHGGYLATEHLIGHGHRRIGHVAGPADWAASEERLAGYRAALGDYGLAFDDALVVRGDWTDESGVRGGLALLTRPERPTAIFAGNDRMAAGVLDAAREISLSSPEDLALVGYDDRVMAQYLRPALTTVALPLREMGVAAAMLLVDQLNDRLPRPVSRLVRGQLVYRGSCGAHSGQLASPDRPH